MIPLRMHGRSLCLGVLLLACSGILPAAAPCPSPAYAPKTSDRIMDWYDAFVRPFRIAAGIQDKPSLSMEEIEAQIKRLGALHRDTLRNSLYFEALTQQLIASYGRAPDFRGLDTQAASKLYQRGAGPDLDFSLICIDVRAGRAAADTFAITLYGMGRDDCRHVGLRGLVFTDTLVNGAANGECRPDHVYFRNWFVPVNGGTNAVTFLCRKDVGGCARH